MMAILDFILMWAALSIVAVSILIGLSIVLEDIFEWWRRR